MRRGLGAAVLALATGCGDGAVGPDVQGAVSGARLALHWYRYTDGTEQPGLDLYDKAEHTDCAPTRWTDGVVRCVPVAEEVVYLDDACTEAVGRRTAEPRPTHFVAYAATAGALAPAHVYRAGPVTAAPVPATYVLTSEGCVGPSPTPDGVVHHQLAAEVDGASLVPLYEAELGDGRLAVRVRQSDDGLRLPLGWFDRELGRACTAAPTAGSVTCAPADAPSTDRFADPQCEQPALVVTDDDAPPTVVQAAAPSGCATYHATGGVAAGPVYRRAASGCVPAPLPAGARVFALGPALALPTMAATVEDVPGRRLQRIALSTGDLSVWDERLLDRATGEPCTRLAIGDDTRCVPAVLAQGQWLSTASCASDVAAVEVPAQACAPATFAALIAGDGLQLRAIGDPIAVPLYRVDGAGCRPYVAPADRVLHALGPALPADTFVGAIYFGER